MEPLILESSYHIYNHTNGSAILFREEMNHLFFLKKYRKHIVQVANTFAYYLMHNNFHVLVTIKKEVEIIPHFTMNAAKKYYNAKSPEEKENVASLFVSK